MIYPIGKVTSTTPGTPVTLASVLPTFLQGQVVVAAYFVALGNNTGEVYVGTSTLNKTTGVGCYVGSGLVAYQTFNLQDQNAQNNRGAASLNNGSAATMNTNNIYFDVDNSGEGFGGYVTY